VPIQALSSAILQVVVVWRGRIIGYQLLDKRRRVTIGEHKNATFLTPTADGRRRFVLLKPKRGGYQLRLAPGMRGEVQVGAGTSDVLDLLAQPALGRSKSPVREVPLSSGDRAKLHFEGNPDLRIEVRWVDPPEVLAKPKVEDPMMFQTLVGTGIVVGLAAALLVFIYAPPEKPLELTAQRIAKIEEPILQLEKKQSARRAKEKEEKKKQEEGQMKKAKEKAGKLGKEDAPTKETVIAKGERTSCARRSRRSASLGWSAKNGRRARASRSCSPRTRRSSRRSPAWLARARSRAAATAACRRPARARAAAARASATSTAPATWTRAAAARAARAAAPSWPSAASARSPWAWAAAAVTPMARSRRSRSTRSCAPTSRA
jgi:hypothetical protein